MADLERLVVNMYEMGDIQYATLPEGIARTNPSYPEHHFFMHSSGRITPFLVSSRNITGFSKNASLPIEEQRATRQLAVSAFCEMLDEQAPYDHLYGLTRTMTPFAGLVAQERGDSLLWGQAGQQFGGASHLKGHFDANDTLATIDFSLTDGNLMLRNADKIRRTGLRVPHLAVLIDYEEGGASNLHADTPSIGVSSALCMREVTGILAAGGKITQEQQEWTTTYYEKLAASGTGQVNP